MELTTKKWLGGFIIGLVTGSVCSWVYLSNEYIDKELSLNDRIQAMLPQDLKAYCPYTVDIEKAYRSGGLIKN